MIEKAFHSLHVIAVLAALDHAADMFEAWQYCQHAVNAFCLYIRSHI